MTAGIILYKLLEESLPQTIQVKYSQVTLQHKFQYVVDRKSQPPHLLYKFSFSKPNSKKKNAKQLNI